MEVTDDKRPPKAERKRLRVQCAAGKIRAAKLIKLADKVCNLRDVLEGWPIGWELERRQAHFDWARAVIDRVRGTHAGLEALFDATYLRRPHA